MSGHHRHDHAGGDSRRLAWAMGITGGFMLVEFAGGWIAGSLALMADAAHMLSDAAALGMAWLAARAARWPADSRRSYGYHRAQVVAAFTNGVVLLLIVAWIGAEAVQRLLEPRSVAGPLMLAVAAVGLVVNLGVLRLLHGGDGHNLNVRAAALHVLGDLLGSVAAILGAMLILWRGWYWADPVLSLLVAVLVLRSAWDVLRRSTHILLEGTPEGVEPGRIEQALRALEAVRDVHHVHVWSLVPGRVLLTLHVVIDPGADPMAVLRRVHEVLARDFGIDHATVQVEAGGCMDELDRPPATLSRT